jgi:1-phosphatidylinositol-4-phosphate 5-kinase
VADEMSGKGTFKWADGRNFEGEFKNGVMHGLGLYTW